ncbi:WecB/TagA/CpsF family glycosyltransferase [Vineibacter terrae]|nr:WecB/TagA/CpsF family glycosyltransferase [Vineibacter terrae]
MTISLPPAAQFSPVPSVPSPAAGIPGADAPGGGTSQTGTSGVDRVVGTPRDKAITAPGGNATILCGDGNDTVDAGAGNDLVDAGRGESFLGCPINILTMAETVELARGSMRDRTRLQHVALNVAKLVNARSDRVLAADVSSSDVVSIDGMGIVWGARLLGLPVKERVPGVDLLARLLAVCAEDGFRPYFLGATGELLQLAVAQALARHPGLRFAGFRDGYFKPDQEADVVREIRDSGADCLFIGMPTPRKERFLAAHRDELNVPFIMGVGGSFDVLSGRVQRAPLRMQALGLEWLYRIYQEPRRMWWRYARTNVLFAAILGRELVRHRLRAAPARPVGRR